MSEQIFRYFHGLGVGASMMGFIAWHNWWWLAIELVLIFVGPVLAAIFYPRRHV